MQQAKVIARVTMTHQNGAKTIIEVHNDAGLQEFYRWYQRGKGKRDKYFIRASHRGDAPDLQSLAERQQKQSERLANGSQGARLYGERKIVAIKLVVFKRRQYKHLLTCSAEQLPGYRPTVSPSFGDALNFGHPRNPYAPKGMGTTRDIPRFRARMKGTFRY